MSRADQSLKIVYPPMYAPASSGRTLRPARQTTAATSSSRSCAFVPGAILMSSSGPVIACGLEK
jgi:hypothetical protein